MQTAALGDFPVNPAAPFGPSEPCMPQYPPYLTDLRCAPLPFKSQSFFLLCGQPLEVILAAHALSLEPGNQVLSMQML